VLTELVVTDNNAVCSRSGIFEAHAIHQSQYISLLSEVNAQGLIPLRGLQIRNLGGKLGEAMAAEYNASTVGDML
jgi:hypothetical protein